MMIKKTSVVKPLKTNKYFLVTYIMLYNAFSILSKIVCKTFKICTLKKIVYAFII